MDFVEPQETMVRRMILNKIKKITDNPAYPLHEAIKKR